MAGIYEANAPIKVQEVGTTIYNIDSAKTPVMRLMATKGRPNQELSEWTVEDYPNDPYGGTLDGTDRTSASDYSHTDREKVQAYAQYQQSPGYLVSVKMEATMTPENKRNEKAHQAMRDGERLALMIEKAVCSDQDTRTESGGTPSRIRGIFSWLQATAQANLPVPSAFRPASAAVHTGALDTLSATAFAAMMAAASEQIKQPVNWTMPCGSALKRLMSLWLEIDDSASATDKVVSQYNMNKADQRLLQVCNRFDFDHGSVTNLLAFNMLTDAVGATTAYSSRSGACMDLSMWDMGYLINPRHRSFPDLGGGPRGDHDAYFVLRCRNPKGQGMVKTNTDS